MDAQRLMPRDLTDEKSTMTWWLPKPMLVKFYIAIWRHQAAINTWCSETFGGKIKLYLSITQLLRWGIYQKKARIRLSYIVNIMAADDLATQGAIALNWPCNPGIWPTAVSALIARFMRPTWGPSGADRTQVGPMLASWTLLSGRLTCKRLQHSHVQKRCWLQRWSLHFMSP